MAKEKMTLGRKQEIFSQNLALLIMFAYSKGYKIRMGQVLRTKAEAQRNAKSGRGIANSLHTQKLAADLNLFKDGKYLTKSSDHAELGAFWKSLHPLNRWGGDFTKPDGNHYSMTHGGRA